MIAKKMYAYKKIVVIAKEEGTEFTLNFENEKQMEHLGECLKDLARSGGTEVSIGEKIA